MSKYSFVMHHDDLLLLMTDLGLGELIPQVDFSQLIFRIGDLSGGRNTAGFNIPMSIHHLDPTKEKHHPHHHATAYAEVFEYGKIVITAIPYMGEEKHGYRYQVTSASVPALECLKGLLTKPHRYLEGMSL